MTDYYRIVRQFKCQNLKAEEKGEKERERERDRENFAIFFSFHCDYSLSRKSEAISSLEFVIFWLFFLEIQRICHRDSAFF